MAISRFMAHKASREKNVTLGFALGFGLRFAFESRLRMRVALAFNSLGFFIGSGLLPSACACVATMPIQCL